MVNVQLFEDACDMLEGPMVDLLGEENDDTNILQTDEDDNDTTSNDEDHSEAKSKNEAPRSRSRRRLSPQDPLLRMPMMMFPKANYRNTNKASATSTYLANQGTSDSVSDAEDDDIHCRTSNTPGTVEAYLEALSTQMLGGGGGNVLPTSFTSQKANDDVFRYTTRDDQITMQQQTSHANVEENTNIIPHDSSSSTMAGAATTTSTTLSSTGIRIDVPAALRASVDAAMMEQMMSHEWNDEPATAAAASQQGSRSIAGESKQQHSRTDMSNRQDDTNDVKQQQHQRHRHDISADMVSTPSTNASSTEAGAEERPYAPYGGDPRHLDLKSLLGDLLGLTTDGNTTTTMRMEHRPLHYRVVLKRRKLHRNEDDDNDNDDPYYYRDPPPTAAAPPSRNSVVSASVTAPTLPKMLGGIGIKTNASSTAMLSATASLKHNSGDTTTSRNKPPLIQNQLQPNGSLIGNSLSIPSGRYKTDSTSSTTIGGAARGKTNGQGQDPSTMSPVSPLQDPSVFGGGGGATTTGEEGSDSPNEPQGGEHNHHGALHTEVDVTAERYDAANVLEDLSLGMKLSLMGGQVIVQKLSSLKDGRTSPAQIWGPKISVGDVLVELNGRNLRGLELNALAQALEPLKAPATAATAKSNGATISNKTKRSAVPPSSASSVLGAPPPALHRSASSSSVVSAPVNVGATRRTQDMVAGGDDNASMASTILTKRSWLPQPKNSPPPPIPPSSSSSSADHRNHNNTTNLLSSSRSTMSYSQVLVKGGGGGGGSITTTKMMKGIPEDESQKRSKDTLYLTFVIGLGLMTQYEQRLQQQQQQRALMATDQMMASAEAALFSPFAQLMLTGMDSFSGGAPSPLGATAAAPGGVGSMGLGGAPTRTVSAGTTTSTVTATASIGVPITAARSNSDPTVQAMAVSATTTTTEGKSKPSLSVITGMEPQPQGIIERPRSSDVRHVVSSTSPKKNQRVTFFSSSSKTSTIPYNFNQQKLLLMASTIQHLSENSVDEWYSTLYKDHPNPLFYYTGGSSAVVVQGHATYNNIDTSYSDDSHSDDNTIQRQKLKEAKEHSDQWMEMASHIHDVAFQDDMDYISSTLHKDAKEQENATNDDGNEDKLMIHQRSESSPTNVTDFSQWKEHLMNLVSCTTKGSGEEGDTSMTLLKKKQGLQTHTIGEVDSDIDSTSQSHASNLPTPKAGSSTTATVDTTTASMESFLFGSEVGSMLFHNPSNGGGAAGPGAGNGGTTTTTATTTQRQYTKALPDANITLKLYDEANTVATGSTYNVMASRDIRDKQSYLLQSIFPIWLNSFKPVKWHYRRVLWPLMEDDDENDGEARDTNHHNHNHYYNKKYKGNSTLGGGGGSSGGDDASSLGGTSIASAGTATSALSFFSTSTAAAAAAAVTNPKHKKKTTTAKKSLQALVEEMEFNNEVKVHTCYLVTYYFVHRIEQRMMSSKQAIQFITQYGAYLELNDALISVAQSSSPSSTSTTTNSGRATGTGSPQHHTHLETIKYLIKMASQHDIRHKESMRELTQLISSSSSSSSSSPTSSPTRRNEKPFFNKNASQHNSNSGGAAMMRKHQSSYYNSNSNASLLATSPGSDAGFFSSEHPFLSALVQTLIDDGFDNSNLLPFLVSAYPDLQPWQVRVAVVDNNNKHSSSKDNYFDYLSALLDPTHGDSSARQNRSLVEEWCQLSVESSYRRNHFYAVAQATNLLYFCDLPRLIDLSLVVNDQVLAVSLAIECILDSMYGSSNEVQNKIFDIVRQILHNHLSTIITSSASGGSTRADQPNGVIGGLSEDKQAQQSLMNTELVSKSLKYYCYYFQHLQQEQEQVQRNTKDEGSKSYKTHATYQRPPLSSSLSIDDDDNGDDSPFNFVEEMVSLFSTLSSTNNDDDNVDDPHNVLQRFTALVVRIFDPMDVLHVLKQVVLQNDIDMNNHVSSSSLSLVDLPSTLRQLLLRSVQNDASHSLSAALLRVRRRQQRQQQDYHNLVVKSQKPKSKLEDERRSTKKGSTIEGGGGDDEKQDENKDWLSNTAKEISRSHSRSNHSLNSRLTRHGSVRDRSASVSTKGEEEEHHYEEDDDRGASRNEDVNDSSTTNDCIWKSVLDGTLKVKK